MDSPPRPVPVGSPVCIMKSLWGGDKHIVTGCQQSVEAFFTSALKHRDTQYTPSNNCVTALSATGFTKLINDSSENKRSFKSQYIVAQETLHKKFKDVFMENDYKQIKTLILRPILHPHRSNVIAFTGLNLCLAKQKLNCDNDDLT